MKELLAQAKERFSVVLLDTPPVLAVIDPVIVSSLVDCDGLRRPGRQDDPPAPRPGHRGDPQGQGRHPRRRLQRGPASAGRGSGRPSTTTTSTSTNRRSLGGRGQPRRPGSEAMKKRSSNTGSWPCSSGAPCPPPRSRSGRSSPSSWPWPSWPPPMSCSTRSPRSIRHLPPVLKTDEAVRGRASSASWPSRSCRSRSALVRLLSPGSYEFRRLYDPGFAGTKFTSLSIAPSATLARGPLPRRALHPGFPRPAGPSSAAAGSGRSSPCSSVRASSRPSTASSS